MYSFKLCTAVFSAKVPFKKALFFSMPVCCYYSGKIDTVAKRASMLKTLINNKDKDKRFFTFIISKRLPVPTFRTDPKVSGKEYFGVPADKH